MAGKKLRWGSEESVMGRSEEEGSGWKSSNGEIDDDFVSNT